MNIGLIKLYEVDTHLQNSHGDYLQMFVRLLKNGGLSAQWRLYDTLRGELPQHLHECDGYIISGSKNAVYENHAWLPPLFAFIQKLHAEKKPPLAGICFGHQAIAQALGGEVIKSPAGWGVGRQSWTIHQHRPWMSPPLTELRLLASHQDQIVRLPPNATPLAKSDFCPHAMFAVGEHIFGIQGHPEFVPEFVQDVLDERQDKIPPSVWQTAKENASQANDSNICAQWLAQFFNRARANF